MWKGSRLKMIVMKKKLKKNDSYESRYNTFDLKWMSWPLAPNDTQNKPVWNAALEKPLGSAIASYTI